MVLLAEVLLLVEVLLLAGGGGGDWSACLTSEASEPRLSFCPCDSGEAFTHTSCLGFVAYRLGYWWVLVLLAAAAGG